MITVEGLNLFILNKRRAQTRAQAVDGGQLTRGSYNPRKAQSFGFGGDWWMRGFKVVEASKATKVDECRQLECVNAVGRRSITFNVNARRILEPNNRRKFIG